jgi:hypothetical protein
MPAVADKTSGERSESPKIAAEGGLEDARDAVLDRVRDELAELRRSVDAIQRQVNGALELIDRMYRAIDSDHHSVGSGHRFRRRRSRVSIRGIATVIFIILPFVGVILAFVLMHRTGWYAP